MKVHKILSCCYRAAAMGWEEGVRKYRKVVGAMHAIPKLLYHALLQTLKNCVKCAELLKREYIHTIGEWISEEHVHVISFFSDAAKPINGCY